MATTRRTSLPENAETALFERLLGMLLGSSLAAAWGCQVKDLSPTQIVNAFVSPTPTWPPKQLHLDNLVKLDSWRAIHPTSLPKYTSSVLRHADWALLPPPELVEEMRGLAMPARSVGIIPLAGLWRLRWGDETAPGLKRWMSHLQIEGQPDALPVLAFGAALSSVLFERAICRPPDGKTDILVRCLMNRAFSITDTVSQRWDVPAVRSSAWAGVWRDNSIVQGWLPPASIAVDDVPLAALCLVARHFYRAGAYTWPNPVAVIAQALNMGGPADYMGTYVGALLGASMGYSELLRTMQQSWFTTLPAYEPMKALAEQLLVPTAQHWGLW